MSRFNSDRIHSPGGISVELTGDAIVTDVRLGKKFYSDDPETQLTGTSTAVETGDADATAPDIILNKTVYVNGNKIIGSKRLGVDQYTKVLLHFDGNHNGTIFTDETGKTWTARGDAKTLNSLKIYGNTSMYLDGTGDYIDTPDNPDFNFGSGNFTIDLWTRVSSVASFNMFFSQYDDANNYFQFYGDTTGVTFVVKNTGTTVAYYNWTNILSEGVWVHIALVRNGTDLYLFKNGIERSTTPSIDISTNSMPDLSTNALIGARMNGETLERLFYGYMDEFRISKGIARWTTDFVPGSPYGG